MRLTLILTVLTVLTLAACGGAQTAAIPPRAEVASTP